MKIPNYSAVTEAGPIHGSGLSDDQVAILARIQQADADECLAEIALVDPGYHAELVAAQYEPCSPFDQGRLLGYTSSDDEEYEPCAYAYENDLCPGVDGVLPNIYENAIYYQPSAAESKRAKRNRTYGITEGDDGIYGFYFDAKGRRRQHIRKPRTTLAERAEAIRARRNAA